MSLQTTQNKQSTTKLNKATNKGSNPILNGDIVPIDRNPDDLITKDTIASPIHKRGGVRIGAGRRAKAQDARAMFKTAFDKFFTQENWEAFIEANKNDPMMLRYMIEQRIGRPVQAIEHSGDVGFVIKSNIPRPIKQ